MVNKMIKNRKLLNQILSSAIAKDDNWLLNFLELRNELTLLMEEEIKEMDDDEFKNYWKHSFKYSMEDKLNELR